ncbi:MAG: hypothetical protein SGILL_007557, partial [Bacillariaceae sp.]
EQDIKEHYNTTNMTFKRFKTQVLDYIDKDSRLENVELAYYLDIDIVFGDPLMQMFTGLETTYGIGERNIDPTNEKHQVKGKGKIESTIGLAKDQWLLLEMLQEYQNATAVNDYSKLECEIGVMAQKPNLEFPKVNLIRRKNYQLGHGKVKEIKHAPMVHLRNDGGVGGLSKQALKYFMRDLLKFDEDQKDVLGITDTMEMETTPRKNPRKKKKKKKKKKSKSPTVEANHTATIDAITETNITLIEAALDETAASQAKQRVLFAVSMGDKASNSKIVERFVWSARNVGLYTNWIVVLTDAEDGRYEQGSNWTDNVIFMKPHPMDIKTQYNTTSMTFKRMKTKVLDYINMDSRLDGVNLAYYLDIDIVFANPLQPLFDDLEYRYGIGQGKAQSEATKSRMWMFHGNYDKTPVQGGQMVLERKESQACLSKLQELFDNKDSFDVDKDQVFFKQILQEQRNATVESNCEIELMTQESYIEFPGMREIRSINNDLRDGKKTPGTIKHSPLVHLRNDGGAASLRTKAIEHYMKDLLKYEEGQIDDLGIVAQMEMATYKDKTL